MEGESEKRQVKRKGYKARTERQWVGEGLRLFDRGGKKVKMDAEREKFEDS